MWSNQHTRSAITWLKKYAARRQLQSCNGGRSRFRLFLLVIFPFWKTARFLFHGKFLWKYFVVYYIRRRGQLALCRRQQRGISIAAPVINPHRPITYKANRAAAIRNETILYSPVGSKIGAKTSHQQIHPTIFHTIIILKALLTTTNTILKKLLENCKRVIEGKSLARLSACEILLSYTRRACELKQKVGHTLDKLMSVRARRVTMLMRSSDISALITRKIIASLRSRITRSCWHADSISNQRAQITAFNSISVRWCRNDTFPFN